MPIVRHTASCCALLIAVSFATTASSQPAPPKPPDAVVAGIPANYEESKVGTYTLPDPLTLADGKPVRDATTWMTKRRPALVKLFEEEQFGRAPGRPAAMRFEVVEKGTAAFDGRATRRQVTIFLTADHSGPKIHLLEYLPAGAKTPAPLLLGINFSANSNAVTDPGVAVGEVWDAKTKTLIPATQGRSFGKMSVEPLIDAGIGFATFYYGDVEPDFAEGYALGIREKYLKPGQAERAPDEWGSIAAWSWGMSRAMDYLETDKDVDAKRVAIHGVSRLGKTVMWAGAHDTRFAAVIASCSGEGGAALSRRNYGETIAHLTAPTRFPYQFALNYGKFGGYPDTAPMDANLLVALIAPRPLLLQTGDTDFWSDPKGEFLAAVDASRVYKLLGKDGLDTTEWPAAKQPILHDLAYYMHDGGHGMVPSDWDIYIQFLKQHLKP